MAEARLSIRIDADVKERAEKVLKEAGLTLSSGVNVFLKKVAAEQGLPFPVTVEQSVTKGYDSAQTEKLTGYSLNEKAYDFYYAARPVARYDESAQCPYLEFPDGRREYNYKEARRKEEARPGYGILKAYANPDLIPLEKGTWEKAVQKKHAIP